MHVVAVVVTPGSPIFELSVPTEVFGMNRADLAEPWYDLRLCGLRPGRVDVDRGFSVNVTYGLEGLETADTVIVPACVNMHDDPPAPLVAAIRAAHARGTRIASICSGAFVLAAAGILDDRRATTHWIYADELARRYPAIRVDASVLYRQDGQVFTSAGTAAGLDLCLELVRQDHGSAVANRLARRLVTPPHRAGGQAQYVETPLPEADDPFSELLDWALARLDRPLTLLDLAQAGHVSTRTLARRFHAALGTSPLRWLLAERIRRAQELLETTDKPIEQVSELVGFGRPSSLREHFLRTTGVSPLAYRRTFRASSRDDPLALTKQPPRRALALKA
jgi:AraC family transcriptional activator FtrA